MAFVHICAAGDVPAGHGKEFKVNDTHLVLFHTEDGFFATGHLCSHAEEPLVEGWLEGSVLECPRHGAQFDLRSGEPLSLPATDPIPVFAVEIRDGEIFADI